MKRYIALARVSSREQEREGFSLEVQEDGFKKFAKKNKGDIVRLFKIAETASKNDERKVFKELIVYAKQHINELDAILFYKIDRAARNLFDYVELERLESVQGLSFISVTQPTENTPSGRMMRRTLANMAAFTTEQQSVDVREGLAKRVQHGLFPSHAPYGYRNIRVNDRGLIEVHPENAAKVQRIFWLYTMGAMTVEQIIEKLFEEGLFYTDSKPQFPPKKVYAMLADRSYLGEVRFRDRWCPGTHTPLTTEEMFNNAQVRLGTGTYRSHQMVYAGELIHCDYCGFPITGERKTKATKTGERSYSYYRCCRYHVGDHPRIRVTEARFDAQVVAFLKQFDERSDQLTHFFARVLQERLQLDLADRQLRTDESKRLLSLIESQKDELLNMRLAGAVDQKRFESKQHELEGRAKILVDQLDQMARDQEFVEKATAKAGSLFRAIRHRWHDADYGFKRRVLETLFGQLRLFKDELRPDNRTPFELLIAG